MMKVSLVLSVLFLGQVSWAQSSKCSPQQVITAIQQTVGGAFTPSSNQKIQFQGELNPGQTKNLTVMVDDFNFHNTSSKTADLFIVSGGSLASDMTVFAVLLNSVTCQKVFVREILHTGGGGL